MGPIFRGGGGAGVGLVVIFGEKLLEYLRARSIKLSCFSSLGMIPKRAYFCFFLMKSVELIYSMLRN